MDNVTPITREEKILSGEDLQPKTRFEYFLKEASKQTGDSGLPEVTSSDEGKVLAVNASGEWAAKNPYDIVLRYNLDEGVVQSVTAIVFNEQSVLDKMAIDAPISIYSFGKTENNLVVQFNAVNIRYYYPLDDRFLSVESSMIYELNGAVRRDNWIAVYDFEAHEWHLD